MTFNNGDNINSIIFYCSSKQKAVSRNGSDYISLVLQDKDGTIDGKIWEPSSPSIMDFDRGDFIKINGTVNSFKDNFQISITSVTVMDKNSIDISEYCPVTPRDIDEMVDYLKCFIESITNEYCKRLLDCFFNNDKFMDRFKTASAAKMVHHAYIGGLLEHTISVVNICNFYSSIYPEVNRDLLITAAICHDIGKVKEISAFPENDYTDIGNLLGHIYIGTEMIDVQARKIDNFPKDLLNEIKHCILAHHGQLEYGSPQTPKLIEAELLHLADLTDSRMRRYSDLINEREDYSWTDKADFFLGSKYRRTKSN